MGLFNVWKCLPPAANKRVTVYISGKIAADVLPACEGVDAGLPQGEAAGVLLLLGLRLPLLTHTITDYV